MPLAGNVTPPPPPRFSGDPKLDLQALIQWVNDFYTAGVRQGYFFSVENQPTAEQITDLPDPSGSNVAQAQQTANTALILATAANNRTLAWDSGSVTISDASTGDTVTLSPAQANASYIVLMQVRAFTGSPPLGATQVIGKSYAAGNFSFTVNAAPGVGNSVTFDWVLVRNI